MAEMNTETPEQANARIDSEPKYRKRDELTRIILDLPIDENGGKQPPVIAYQKGPLATAKDETHWVIIDLTTKKVVGDEVVRFHRLDDAAGFLIDADVWADRWIQSANISALDDYELHSWIIKAAIDNNADRGALIRSGDVKLVAFSPEEYRERAEKEAARTEKVLAQVEQFEKSFREQHANDLKDPIRNALFTSMLGAFKDRATNGKNARDLNTVTQEAIRRAEEALRQRQAEHRDQAEYHREQAGLPPEKDDASTEGVAADHA